MPPLMPSRDVGPPSEFDYIPLLDHEAVHSIRRIVDNP